MYDFFYILFFLLTGIKDFDGRSWATAIRSALTTMVDTRESATGTHMLGLEWRASLPLKAVEQQRKANGAFSSTEVGVLCILCALQEGLRNGAMPNDGSGAAHVGHDNQRAVTSIRAVTTSSDMHR